MIQAWAVEAMCPDPSDLPTHNGSMVPPMLRTALITLTLLVPFPASATTEEEPPDLERVEMEPIPDLPVVEASLDPVRELVAQAANPNASEDVAQARFNEVVSRGQVAVPTLAAIYREAASSELEVWVAARVMGRIGGEGSLTTLISGLKSRSVIARLGAVAGLQEMKDKAATEPLEKALFDKAMTVRASAADALATIGSRRSSGPLSEALNIPANFKNGKSLPVRRHIIVALGEIGSIGGIEALVETLDAPEPDLQLAATKALTKITGMSFRPTGTGADAPVSAAEIQSWKNWWSGRKVGKQAE